MNLLSEIISKPVLNLYSGKIEGTVMNALFDSAYKKIQYFKIFDADEEEYLVNTSKIYSIGKNCLVIRNSDALTIENTQNTKAKNNPLGLEIYSANGDKLSVLTDVELKENFEIKNFIASSITLSPENILNIGNIIVVNNENKKINKSYFKPKIKKANPNTKTNVIKIMPTASAPVSAPLEAHNNLDYTQPKTIDANFTEIDNTPTPQIAEDVAIDTTPQNLTKQISEPLDAQKDNSNSSKQGFKIHSAPTPQRIVGNGNFLIGRKAVKTIYGLNNEIIIKKDSIINEKNLESAKKHSKLMELTVFSKIKA